MKKPTQTDVARLAGVSRATVSYVVNGKVDMGVPISDDTRRRVLAAVKELGYVVNAGAQALRSGDTKTIGVMLPIYENPFFWEVLNGISAQANEAGYKVLLANSVLGSGQRDKGVLELAEQRLDGLILMMGLKSLPTLAKSQLRASTHPIIEISSAKSEFDYVNQDYSDGMQAIMSHLFELGHRRIVYVHGVHRPEEGLDRLTAFEQMARSRGLSTEEAFAYECGPSMDNGYQTVRYLLQQHPRPTALIMINDLLGVAAVRAAVDLGFSVPYDVSVASFDDIPFSSYSVPRLTTVAGDPAQNGRDAVSLLLLRLKQADIPQQVVNARWQLYIRESTGPVPD